MSSREGGLQAPTRHPLGWTSEDFYNEEKCLAEMDLSLIHISEPTRPY